MMKRIYLKESKFDFGTYKGYEVGMVFFYDPSYVRWCINNVDQFFISDLEDLLKTGVKKQASIRPHYIIGNRLADKEIEDHKTLKEALENYTGEIEEHHFSEEVIKKNNDNARYHQSNRTGYDYIDSDDSDLLGSSGIEMYGGYNGYDDDTIDCAFEGDPEATWNVD